MPRVCQDLVDRQRRAGFVTVAEASLRSGVRERTLREWVKGGSVKARRVGPMLVFVEAASLEAAIGGTAGPTDDEILADIAAARKATPAVQVPLRELTLERDE